jgi:uncharacterized protein (DUF433 family)
MYDATSYMQSIVEEPTVARYPLNLPAELQRDAAEYARRQGVSLNQFILWSLAEKVGTLQASLDDPAFPGIAYRRGASGQPTAVIRGTGVRVQTVATANRRWGESAAAIAAEYDLPERRIREALDFYAAHQGEIDAAIRAEDELAPGDA